MRLVHDLALAAALALPSLALLAWWGGVWFAMRQTRRQLGDLQTPVFSPDAAPWPPAAPPRVCLITPAHNEARSIAAHVRSLRDQTWPAFRGVLALDRCTDATLPAALDALQADPRIEIVEITACPEDWAGKVHAIETARLRRPEVQDADILIFTDADTVLHPRCVEAAVELLVRERLDMLSLLSTLTFTAPFERSAQGPAAFELLVRYPPLRASRAAGRRPFANGQFIACTQDAYQRLGTHAAFRAHLLEDIAIARAAWDARLAVRVLPAGAMLTCRMYPDALAFERGWRRIFTEAANRKVSRLRSWARLAPWRNVAPPLLASIAVTVAIVRLITSPEPAARLAWVAVGALSVALGLVWLLVVARFLRQLGASDVRTLLAALVQWPRGTLALARLLARAARDLEQGIATPWAGREYARPAR